MKAIVLSAAVRSAAGASSGIEPGATLTLRIRLQKMKLSGVKLVERAPQKHFLTAVAKAAA
jgi:hypothetical protein